MMTNTQSTAFVPSFSSLNPFYRKRLSAQPRRPSVSSLSSPALFATRATLSSKSVTAEGVTEEAGIEVSQPVALQSTTGETVAEKTPVEDSLALLEWPAITERVLRSSSTELGRRRLLNPSNPRHLYIPETRTESEALLELTREMVRLRTILGARLDFKYARDIAPMVRLATKGRVLNGDELLSIARTLGVARSIRRAIIDAPADVTPALRVLVEPLKTATAAERELLRCVEETGELSESAHPALRNVRNEIRAASNDAHSTLTSLMAQHADAVQDRLVTSRYDRFVIPVKATHKAMFRSGIVHDASASGNTAFIEPASVRPINDRLRTLAAKERSVILAALRHLTEEVVVPIADDGVAVCDALATLDAASARAQVSDALHAVDVKFDNENSLYLPSVRHPMLMWAVADARTKVEQKNENGNQANNPPWLHEVVPSTYVLSPSVRCVCVTGPNTGGKTLSLKTLGVVALMAKAGLFIPASPSSSFNLNVVNGTPEKMTEDTSVSIPYFDNVLADIGDDQSLVQSLSTFSGHVRRIKRILSATTSQSLVLLDEIGSGTDPAEGAALGMAVLRHLAVGRHAFLTFATTHHGELKTLKYTADESAQLFENASVEFDDVAMRPTFRLVWGIPGRSNALAIAERLGLNEKVISEARSFLTSVQGSDDERTRVDIEKMIRSLESDKKSAEEARIDAERKLSEVVSMRHELDSRLNSLRKREAELRKEQRMAMDAEVTAARKEIARVIRNLQQNGSAQAASRASDQLKAIETRGMQDSNHETERIKVSADSIAIGDRVVVYGMGDEEVEVVDKISGKEIVVAKGPMKVKAKLSSVVSVRRPSSSRVKKNTSSATVTSSELSTSGGSKKLSMRTAANSIDVRGQRVHGATTKIDSAIDKALPMGALWIIHGHGTGRLRSGVRSFLAEHPLVSKVEDAEQSEGGSGVSIAYF